MNAIGQRTNVEQGGTAFSSARGIAWGYGALGQVTSTASSIPVHNRAYEYDAIGNRKKSADSLTLPATDNYASNAVNQYTAVNSVTPGFDDDGNATSYPVPAHSSTTSTLGWDAENRLVSAAVNGVTTTYLYDAYSRRIAIKQGSATMAVIYDSWNPVGEYSFSSLSTPSTALVKSHVWGLDLISGFQGAGGVGGLLAVIEHGSTTSDHYYPTYDGNGNVSEYLDETGVVAAHYEYDPFGRTVVATGAKAADFAHRFSTKPLDDSTGFYYYGYRFYDPVTGRWPSRDPIGEVGGQPWFDAYEEFRIIDTELLGLSVKHINNSALLEVIEDMRSLLLNIQSEPTESISDLNLYLFVGNDAKNYFDRLGLAAEGNQCSDEFKNWSKEDLDNRYKELGKGKRTKEEKAQRQRIKREQKGRGSRHSRGGNGGGRLGALFFFLDFMDYMENDGKLPDADSDGIPDACDMDPNDPCPYKSGSVV